MEIYSDRPYLTLIGPDGGLAGHDGADGMAIWPPKGDLLARPIHAEPIARVRVSQIDAPSEAGNGRWLINVETSDRSVNVRAWSHTVTPGPGRHGNVWSDSGSYRDPLDRAIRIDHWCDDDSSCDIEYARRSGFIASAASLLIGATETPAVSAIIECLDLDLRALADAEEDDWSAWHETHSIECGACGSFNYSDDPHDLFASPCGNCAKALTAAE